MNFILAGVIFGLAVLTRSVLLYFPVVIVLLAFLYRPPAEKTWRRRRLLQTTVTIFIMLVISFSWGIRNKAVHDTFTVSGTGRLAAKLFLANEVMIRAEGRHVRDFKTVRDSLYQDASSRYRRGTYAEAEKDNRQFVLNVFKNHPLIFIKTYFMNVLKNITAVSSIQHLQLPQYSDILHKIDLYVNRRYHNPLVLIFSLTGLVLLMRRNIRIALILLLVAGYFALLTGVTFAQGSRIFFPAIVAQSILVSITLLFLYDILRYLSIKIRSKIMSPRSSA
jgi:4-amino-4-deoxy-L-arabinose transferase-like glycosyltransferase